MDWKNRLKNPYFWIGLVGVILSAMGVSPEMFTSWGAVIEQIKEMFSNPYMLSSVCMAVLGVIVNPATKGLKDK